MSYLPDWHNRFNSDLWCVVSPGEEKNLRHDIKLLLSETKKAELAANFKKKHYSKM